MSGLLDDLLDEPPRLKLERPGDGVYGTVIKLTYATNRYHPEGYPVVTVHCLDGRKIAVHAMWSGLAREIEDLHLRVGDEFAVVYDGERESSSGRTYRVFRAASRRPQ